LLVAALGGLLYWLSVRDYESTDDAFIAARNFSIAPKVGGYITDVPVTDNQHIAAGELLAKVDDRDYKIAVDQAKAQVRIGSRYAAQESAAGRNGAALAGSGQLAGPSAAEVGTKAALHSFNNHHWPRLCPAGVGSSPKAPVRRSPTCPGHFRQYRW
jgi:multidrug resistance efflux pump